MQVWRKETQDKITDKLRGLMMTEPNEANGILHDEEKPNHLATRTGNSRRVNFLGRINVSHN